MSVNELIYLFRKSQKYRPIVLLGAGASFRSGIPMASDMVKRIATASYAKQVKGMDWRHCQVAMSDWRLFLQRKDWFISDPDKFVDNYPLAIEHLLVPREFRREFFEDVIIPPNGINEGYKHLAELVRRGLCWTILTTNFDHLIVEALRNAQPPIRDFIEINRTQDDWIRFNPLNRRQVVYLHGSVEFYRDKNLVNEIQRLESNVVNNLRPMLASQPLVVIGYRGSEPSLMEHFFFEGVKACSNYRHGIYWCLLENEEPHPNVNKFQEKIGSNLRILRIKGFDELMETINLELKDEAIWDNSQETVSPTQSFENAYDKEVLEDKSLSDLDRDLIFTTLKTYCERLKLPEITQENYLSFMREQGLLTSKNGKYVPTIGCYLLFGQQVSETFPYSQVAFTKSGKKRIVFEGNLITQYQAIKNYLSSEEVNKLIRVKTSFDSDDVPSYPDRALNELLVNMLVHRDYESEDYSRIEYVPGKSLCFINPGGLPEATIRKIRINESGKFTPKRNVSEVRNGLLADVFWGLGSMDKAGSGLADVQELMRENGGSSDFTTLDKNQRVRITLFQPVQRSPKNSNVATRITKYETYTTNLLPFAILPKHIFILPLKEVEDISTPLFQENESARDFPIFIKHGGSMYSFADFQEFENFAARRGYLEEMKVREVDDFVLDKQDRNIFSWLIRKHWEFFLRQKSEFGLRVENRDRMAYFVLIDGEQNTIRYNSRARKNVRRVVVKRRERNSGYIEHENEGFYYSVENFADLWAIQIKTTYVFTSKDGQTPIPSHLMSQRTTKRFKFDRNKNVDDDLSFWARFLSDGRNVINIGGTGVNDLILEFEYTTAEVPLPEREVEIDEA